MAGISSVSRWRFRSRRGKRPTRSCLAHDPGSNSSRTRRFTTGRAAGVGSGLAAQAEAKRPPACITKLIIDRQEDDNGNDAPYLTVNTKFWEVDSLKQDVWHTVFRTVHVGDEVKAYEHDALDPDDRIGKDVVTGFN